MNRRRFTVHAIALLLAALPLAALPSLLRAQPAPGAGAAQAAVVRLVVDYGDGVEKHFTALPCKEGMTVQGAMEAARAHPRGITFEATGSGERAFLKSIDGQANEGGGKGARNWLYSVNAKMADRSFGVATLQPGDTVLWSFRGRQPPADAAP